MSIFTTFRFDCMESRCRLVTSPIATRIELARSCHLSRARERTCLSPEFHGDARVRNGENNNGTDIRNREEDPLVSRTSHHTPCSREREPLGSPLTFRDFSGRLFYNGTPSS